MANYVISVFWDQARLLGIMMGTFYFLFDVKTKWLNKCQIDRWLNELLVDLSVGKHNDEGCSCVRATGCCHVHLCADNDPWPCCMPPGPGQPHLSTWCGWQSVYPAGPPRPYFQPLTHTNEKPGRLLAFLSQACWHAVQPTTYHKYQPSLKLDYTQTYTCRHGHWCMCANTVHVDEGIHTRLLS